MKDFKALGVTKDNKVYRIALGKLIDAEERGVFKAGWKAPDLGTKTGSIGFIDLLKRKEWVPKQYPKDKLYLTDFEPRDVLTILTIGIEPLYRGKGFATKLIKRAEEIAKKNRLNEIIAHTIMGDTDENARTIMHILDKLEYFSYNDNMAIKKIK